MGTYGDATGIKNRAGVDKDDLGLTQTEFDDLVQSARENASRAVENYAQRDFEHHTGETHKLVGNGRYKIRVPGYPVLSVTEIREDDDTVDSADYYIEQLENHVFGNAGVIVSTSGRWPRPTTPHERNIEIDYDWGFSTTPADVNDIVNYLATQDLLDFVRNVQARGATQISLEGMSMGFGTAEERQLELTDDHKEKLDPYRRISKG